MSPVRVTFSRTVGRICNLSSTALAIGGFLAASSLMFALGLEKAEGSALTIASVWATSVAPVLPVLAAVLSMDVWSDERISGRIDILLSTPVRERELAVGKFLGVWCICLISILASFLTCALTLRNMAPAAMAQAGMASFLPGIFVLSLQSLLWCAVSVLMSTFFRHAAAAASVSVAVLCGLPRGIWAALLAWSSHGRTAFGELPFDAHVTDMSLGLISLGTVVSYMMLAAAMMFVCAKSVETMRLVGRGAAKTRAAIGLSVLLSLVLSCLLVTLALRLDVAVELPSVSAGHGFSQRTKGVLAESSGDIVATCFLPRSDPMFRPVSHMLRALRKAAVAQGGANMELRYVDPRWDLADSQRLVRLGVTDNSVIFERKRRRFVVPLADGFGERMFATAIQRLTTPQQRSTICWTIGHGEFSFSDYGAFGMSDIARELSRDGFRNVPLDLSAGSSIPGDCALIIVAGAKEDFSLIETDRIDSYLKQGGRLLMLVDDSGERGVVSLLSAWGMRVSSEPLVGARTLSGTDVIASSFADHVVTAPLSGTQIVMEHPASLEPSAATAGLGVDGVEFVELVRAGGRCLAAIVERGGGTGTDIALRPTRIVVIGDPMFVMNGQLAARGNANRDFFLNSVAYLAGINAVNAGGDEGGRLSSGMDRKSRVRFVRMSAGFVPLAVFLILLARVAIHRWRT